MSESTSATRTLGGQSVPVAGTWVIDPTHTRIGFEARHLMVTKVRGHFEEFAGTLTIADRPEDSSAEVTMRTESITTGTADRDAHLRSPDFLDVDTYPEVAFRSTAVDLDGNEGRLHGDLTIRDQTHPITLDFEVLGVVTDPWGNAKAAFTASAELERETWGLTWNVPLEGGGFLVSKKVKLEIDAQAALQA